MPDYKNMYLKLFRATEQVLNTLIAVQRECEELYVSSPDSELKMILLSSKPNEDSDEE